MNYLFVLQDLKDSHSEKNTVDFFASLTHAGVIYGFRLRVEEKKSIL